MHGTPAVAPVTAIITAVTADPPAHCCALLSAAARCGQIRGPDGSPYEGGWYTVSVELPPTYPFSPPVVCGARVAGSGTARTDARGTVRA